MGNAHRHCAVFESILLKSDRPSPGRDRFALVAKAAGYASYIQEVWRGDRIFVLEKKCNFLGFFETCDRIDNHPQRDRLFNHDKMQRSSFTHRSTMKVISLSAHFDGQSIQLDEPYPLQANTKLIVTILPEQPSEREAWLSLSSTQLNSAYTEDDDYPLNAITTVNPDYEGS